MGILDKFKIDFQNLLIDFNKALFLIENSELSLDKKKIYMEEVEKTLNKFLDKEYLIRYIADSKLKSILNKVESELGKEEMERIVADYIINDYIPRIENNKELKHYFNQDVLSFIRKNNINVEKMINWDECIIYSANEINPLIKNYRISKDVDYANVSIANIVGYDRCRSNCSRNILLSMRSYFKTGDDPYRNRSVGLLKYSNEEIMEALEKSFNKEYICVEEVDLNKYCIVNNGFHRYTILRVHYLLEKLKGISPEEELKNKYEIPVILLGIDYFKTYCNFLINCLGLKVEYFVRERNELNKSTDNVLVGIYNEEELVLSDGELKEFIESRLDFLNEENKDLIIDYYNKYESFRRFIDENFGYLIKEDVVLKSRVKA